MTLTFKDDHDKRFRERLEAMLVGATKFHTVEEMKAQLERKHGVRVSKTEIVSALGKLKAAGYKLEKIQRGPDPYYKLGGRAIEQSSLFDATKGYPD